MLQGQPEKNQSVPSGHTSPKLVFTLADRGHSPNLGPANNFVADRRGQICDCDIAPM